MSDDDSDDVHVPGRRRAAKDAAAIANAATALHAVGTKLGTSAGKLGSLDLNARIQRLRELQRELGNAGDYCHQIRRDLGLLIDAWLSSDSTPP